MSKELDIFIPSTTCSSMAVSLQLSPLSSRTEISMPDIRYFTYRKRLSVRCSAGEASSSSSTAAVGSDFDSKAFSDGWDRTSQLVSLSTILLDPYYRSVRGFQVLIEKDWIAFGHQFAQRTGVHGRNELSPIFMQFVDCVGQLISKYPLSFEFTEDYLVALLDMVLSGQFGAFLCDSDKERDQWDASISFECLWTHFSSLRSDSHINHNYRPDTDSETISFDANGYRLHPLRKLHLRWRSLECSNSTGWND